MANWWDNIFNLDGLYKDVNKRTGYQYGDEPKSSTLGVSSWNPDNMGRPIPGGTDGQGANYSDQQNANFANTGNINFTPSAMANMALNNSNNSDNGMAEILKIIAASSGGGSGGNNNAYNLGMAELNYKKQNDARQAAIDLEALNFGRNKDARILGGMENYYNTGSYGKGFDKLLGMIADQGKISSDAVTDAYGRATKNINQGYDAAQGLGDSGYRALNAYLGANPNNPYAGMQAGVGSAPDALTQYLSAYGVSDQPVQGQIQADQLQAQQGAGNYQNLIDILSGVAQSGASSRGAESAMGQNLFNTSLGQERAGYQGAATNAQQQALNALQQQMFQSRFGVENDRNSLANQLAQQIITAGGTVGAPVAGAPVAGALVAGASPVAPSLTIEQLLKQIAERQAAGTGSYEGSGGGYGTAPGMDMYAF